MKKPNFRLATMEELEVVLNDDMARDEDKKGARKERDRRSQPDQQFKPPRPRFRRVNFHRKVRLPR